MLKKTRELWLTLQEPIYVGERLEANLHALMLASVVSAGLGLVLVIQNILSHDIPMLIGAVATVLASAGCGFSAGVLKNRELAGLFPTVFCGIAFTIYALTGVGEGSAMMWTLLMPIGVSYFVSVKNGLLLSIYYSLFFGFLFHSPLQENVSAYYSASFMFRFPLLFLSVSLLTGIAMVQYHRMALFEIEHTNRLNEEVQKQTQVVREQAKRLGTIADEVVQTLAHVIDAKDRYTNGHSVRVSAYAAALAEKLGWSKEEEDMLRYEALLHDVGKIGVPDSVLNKPGRLTDEEFSVIKSHTNIGGDILAESGELLGAAKTARFHHERYDGTGYPQALKGEEIPVHARVVAIADAYDAMHSNRVYRKGLPRDVIRSELVRGRGTQFDPVFLDAFLQLFDSGELDIINDLTH